MFERWWVMNKAAPAKSQCRLENTCFYVFILLIWHKMSADAVL